MDKILTIIIPCYNEEKTIQKIIQKVLKQEYIEKQIIVVDDKSSDDSIKKILILKNKINKIIFHNKNKGKGACIRSAQKYVKGDILIIQDADLEYDPKDYKKLIDPIIKVKKSSIWIKSIGKIKKQLKKFSNQVLEFLVILYSQKYLIF